MRAIVELLARYKQNDARVRVATCKPFTSVLSSRAAPSRRLLQVSRRAMGSGRDKRKKANPKPAGAGREKTERKTVAAEEKRRRRAERGGADEDDIDALLARVKLADEGGGVVVEEGIEPPSRRVSATFTHAAGPRSGELLLYGGEWYDNAKTRVYGDLFRFDTLKRRWAHVRSPGAPPPRSAHQAVAYKSFLFIFGGEFTSPNQARAAHPLQPAAVLPGPAVKRG
jgi:hypothetical protein